MSVGRMLGDDRSRNLAETMTGDPDYGRPRSKRAIAYDDAWAKYRAAYANSLTTEARDSAVKMGIEFALDAVFGENVDPWQHQNS